MRVQLDVLVSRLGPEQAKEIGPFCRKPANRAVLTERSTPGECALCQQRRGVFVTRLELASPGSPNGLARMIQLSQHADPFRDPSLLVKDGFPPSEKLTVDSVGSSKAVANFN